MLRLDRDKVIIFVAGVDELEQLERLGINVVPDRFTIPVNSKVILFQRKMNVIRIIHQQLITDYLKRFRQGVVALGHGRIVQNVEIR